MQYDVAVIIGSTRRGRNTPRLARLVYRKLQQSGRADPTMLDLAEYDLPMMQERLANLEEPPPRLAEFAARIDAAHAVVIATPEYNKGYPAVLKNAIDYLGSEFRRKPVGIVTHSVGAFAGTVVLQQLRIVMLNLGAVPVPAAVTVPGITRAIDEKGNALDEAFERRGAAFVHELLWYTEALARQRELHA